MIKKMQKKKNNNMKLLTTLTQSKWCYEILLPSPAYLVGGFKNSLVLFVWTCYHSNGRIAKFLTQHIKIDGVRLLEGCDRSKQRNWTAKSILFSYFSRLS